MKAFTTPFSILNFFEKGKRFSSYWFATGTPTFLIDLIKQRNFYIPDLEKVEIAEDELESFDAEQRNVKECLFEQVENQD